MDERDTLELQFGYRQQLRRSMGAFSSSERATVNYDHPDALETPLLVCHAKALLDGMPAGVPVYDFSTHTRTDRTVEATPRRAVIPEGILVLAERELRS